MLPWVQLVWESPAVRLPPCVTPLWIPRTAEHPGGFKGECLRYAYQHLLGGAPGLVVVDGDSAFEPPDAVELERSVCSRPDAIWTAAVRTWGADLRDSAIMTLPPGEQRERILALARESPGATAEGDALRLRRRPLGDFAHRTMDASGQAHYGTPEDREVAIFGFGMLYVPREVWRRVDESGRWGELAHPQDDRNLARIAREAPAVPAFLCPGARCIHVHWSSEDVAEWRRETERG